MIRLVAIDVDGTLLNSKNQLTTQTKEMIGLARNLGIKIVLCTGRPFQGIRNLLQELQLDTSDEFAISFNGAVIQELGENNILLHQPLSFEALQEIEAISRKLKVPYHIQSDDAIYTSNQDISYYTAYDSHLNGSLIKYRTLAELQETPVNKILFVGHPDFLEDVIKKIPKNFFEDYNLMKSLDYFFEFLHKDANKGTALKKLAEKLTIQPEEIAAIGDNDNDISMLEFAGFAIAMGNASEKAKQAADFITKSNDENGVVHAFQQFLSIQ